jgi:hypothetical protein
MGFQPGLAASKLGFLTSPPWRAIRRIGLAREVGLFFALRST